MTQQTGQQALVDDILLAGHVQLPRLPGIDVHLASDLPQLRIEVLPFPDAQKVQVLAFAQFAELRGREFVLLLLDVLPQHGVGQKVRGLVLEPLVELVSGLPMLKGPFARILHGQGRGEHHDLAGAIAALGLHDHASQPRVHRQGRQDTTGLGERRILLTAAASSPGPLASARRRRPLAVLAPSTGAQGTQLAQQHHAVRDGAGIRLLHEREIGDVRGLSHHAHRDHLQYDRRQIGAQDLRVREFGAGVEVLLGVQPKTDTVRNATAPPGALTCRRLGNPFDRQPLHLGARGVPRNPGGARIDHVLDPGDGQGRLRHVGREHDPAFG